MQYRCSVCGYVYDEDKEGVPFTELPDTWQCPWCSAPKSSFELVEDIKAEDHPTPASSTEPAQHTEAVPHDMQKLSVGQMAALCSNLARGCEKQYMPQEQALFNELADWFTKSTPQVEDATVEAIAKQLQQDLNDYKTVDQISKDNKDRGAQRVCVWGEKVTRMLSVLVERYQKEGDAMLQDTDIWVCSICGFVFIGKEAPELCPVCKVPAWKFNKIDRRK